MEKMQTTIGIKNLEKVEDSDFPEWDALTENEDLFNVIYVRETLIVKINHKIIMQKSLKCASPVEWKVIKPHLRIRLI